MIRSSAHTRTKFATLGLAAALAFASLTFAPVVYGETASDIPSTDIEDAVVSEQAVEDTSTPEASDSAPTDSTQDSELDSQAFKDGESHTNDLDESPADSQSQFEEQPAPSSTFADKINEQEPNNSTSKAQTLPLNTVVSSIFGPRGDCDNDFYDCDFYRVEAPKSGQLKIDLRFASTLGTDSQLLLSILNAQGTLTHSVTVNSSDYDGAKLQGLFITVGSGTNYISLKTRVTTMSGTPVWKGQKYELSATMQALTAEIERNATSATANQIALGSRVYGSAFNGDCNNNFNDCDFYRATLSKTAKLTVDFKSSCNLGTYRPYVVTAYGNDGKALKEVTLGGPECAGAPFSFDAPAGNVYLRVYTRLNTETGKAAFGKPYDFAIGRTLTSGTPTISGTPQVGSTLTANPGTWGPTPVTLKYQWKRNGQAISGATTSTYKAAAADIGTKLTVSVSGTRSEYIPATRTSTAVTISKTSTPVSRLAGADRFSTSAAISKASFSTGTPVAYVANGLNFPDALAGAAAAGHKGGPVLLSDGRRLTADVAAELQRLKPKRIVVLGGTGAVSSELENILKNY